MPLAQNPLSLWRARAKTFNFKDHEIRYWVAGQGEPLLLLHGFAGASWDWQQVWQLLAQRYRVIACDMLGFGDSAKPLRNAYRLATQADLQQALLTHLEIERPVHLLAHDYGALVAQELIARHAEGVASLASAVFLNAGLFAEADRGTPLQKLLSSSLGWVVARTFNRQTLIRLSTRLYGTDGGPSEGAFDDQWDLLRTHYGTRVLHRLACYGAERSTQRERWLKAMQQGGVPMRLMVGTQDPACGLPMLDRYRQLIVPADTVVLDDAGHFPHIEVPEHVLHHYLAFRGEAMAFSRQLAASWAATAR